MSLLISPNVVITVVAVDVCQNGWRHTVYGKYSYIVDRFNSSIFLCRHTFYFLLNCVYFQYHFHLVYVNIANRVDGYDGAKLHPFFAPTENSSEIFVVRRSHYSTPDLFFREHRELLQSENFACG
jgi:hypothetical protein